MFLLWTTAFLLGSSTLNLLHVLPNLLLLYLVVVVNAFFCTYSKGTTRKLILLSLGYFLGLLWVTGYATWLLSTQLPEDQVGKTQTVTGTIATSPEARGRGMRFHLESKAMQRDKYSQGHPHFFHFL